jgi:hypothetical protein
MCCRIFSRKNANKSVSLYGGEMNGGEMNTVIFCGILFVYFTLRLIKSYKEEPKCPPAVNQKEDKP